VQVGLVALVVGIVAQVIAHRADAVLAFWDAQAHLDIARRITDALTPGLQMLGTVWLPVPHLLYLPLVMVDAWWWSGLAGGIVGLAAYVATVVATHDIATRRLDGRWPPRVATAVVMFAPSLLYLQATAMTEPLLLGFLTASVALLDRWWDDRASPRLLVLAGLAAGLAVGSRYDGWFFVAVAVPLVWWRSRRLGDALRFAAAPLLMVALWGGYNWHYFGDPLEFQRGVWSAAAQQAVLAEQGLLPTRGAPLRSIITYLGAVALACGVIVTVAGGIGAANALRRAARPAVLLLGAALPFNILALVAGQSVITLPWLEPRGVMNVRYGLMLLPMLALGVGAFLAWVTAAGGTRPATVAFAALLAVQLGHWGWAWPARVGALREGLAIRDGDRVQMDASRWLATHYDRGRVLVAPAVNVSPRTRIAMRDRIYPWSWQLGDSALAHPADVVDWVIVDRRAATDPVTLAVTADSAFGRDFLRVFARERLEIWQRR
jgi:4-amino-4-deoxy-L-arabinose transferase-like glycosyltransferase